MVSTDPIRELEERIDSVLVERPPARILDGGFVREGVNRELDQFRDVHSGGHSWITSKRDEERERTGIPNLTISSNKVFGYYIEVSRSHLEKVPEHYIRKQTLVNAERFITPELKEVEAKIFRAGEEIERLEKEVFEELRSFAAGYIEGIRKAGKMLAGLDVLLSLARLALERDYVRPKLADKPGIRIEKGRHPVLDVLLPQGECVPNSVQLDQRRRILLVTGPNMAGKSTYLSRWPCLW